MSLLGRRDARCAAGSPSRGSSRRRRSRMSTLMNFSPRGGGRPSTVIGPHAIIWLSGSAETPPAAVTPGQRAEPFPELAVGFEHDAAFGILPSRHRQLERQHVDGVEAWRHAAGAAMKLRTRSPAPISSITESASSATTSSRRMFWPRPQTAPAPDDPRLASFRLPCRSQPARRSAGARPKRMPDRIDTRQREQQHLAS